MTKESIKENLLNLLGEFVNENHEVNIDGIDSFQFIQIIISIEDQFGIEFDDEMLLLENLNDLNLLSNYIESKKLSA